MKPESVSEQMMYNTIRIVASDGSCGTGLYFNFNVNGHIVPVVITNKHVVNYNRNETTTFLFILKIILVSLTETFK